MTPAVAAARALWTAAALQILRDLRARVKYASPGVTITLSGDRMILADRDTEIQRATEYLSSEDWAEVCSNAGYAVRLPALVAYISSATPAIWNPERQQQLSMDLTPCHGARTMGQNMEVRV